MARAASVLLAATLACGPHFFRAPTQQPPERAAPSHLLQGCMNYGPARIVGRVPQSLRELSGLAASVRHPGIFWAHNDSGHPLALYAMNERGAVLATLSLVGVGALDTEAIAVGPCTAASLRSCIYVADTGDNFLVRRSVQVLKVPEPEVLEDAALGAEALPFSYPEGAQDAESLLVDVHSGRLAVLTKQKGSLGRVYALDGASPGRPIQATLLGIISSPTHEDELSTDASLHPTGQRLLIRTAGHVWELRGPRASRLEELLKGEVVEVPGAQQPQAEAIAYGLGGNSYLLGTEFAGEGLYAVSCR